MIGQVIGPYQVLSKLGEGGMGAVYRARDARLNRDVALKVLPDLLAADPERLSRFIREAQTLAALNHPNIAHLHGLEETTAAPALVMEFVDGDDLSALIARGAIALADAVPIARQIAEALEVAHEQGIIHRDLKPANIKVRPDGTVKILDFGLAKALDQSGGPGRAGGAGGDDLLNSPTLTSPAVTMPGVILGTAAYMSPEQAKGKPVDKRSDIWAFGAVLFEMLSGRRPFEGDDVSTTLASVLMKEPDWSALPVDTPATIHKLLRRCLEKDRKRRLDSAAAARLELDDALTTPRAATTTTGSNRASARLAWTVAAMLFIAFIAGLAVWSAWQTSSPLPETRLDIVTPDTERPTSFALSPDGRYIAFVASSDGGSRLWVRSLATTTAQPLPGTEGAVYPFWSPDSRSIGFAASNALKRVDLNGGAGQVVAPASAFRGGTWGADGVIVYAPSVAGPLMRVPATGGNPTAIPISDSRHQSHRWPHVLPDGRRFLFYATGPPETGGIYLGSLDGAAPIRLTPGRSAGVYLPVGRGWLVWIRSGTLVAQRLDLETATLSGEPMALAEGLLTDDTTNQSSLSAAATGALAYRSGTLRRRQLTWFDRSGTRVTTWGAPDSGNLRAPKLSPDGLRVAVSRTEQGNEDLWLIDSARMVRFTFDPGNEIFPVWSPDGSRIVFRSDRQGRGDIYEKATIGGLAEVAFLSSENAKSPLSWSMDGRFLLHSMTDSQFNYDIWVVPTAGEVRTPSPLANSPFREMWGVFSPDNRWVAYMSNESGRDEVYVRPFLSAGSSGTAVAGQWQVSTSGGNFPVWRRDGKELYYLTNSGELMAAPIAVNATTLQPGVPVKLFDTRIAGGGAELGMGRQYDVAPDGRFLINMELDDVSEPIRLLLNWHPDSR